MLPVLENSYSPENHHVSSDSSRDGLVFRMNSRIGNEMEGCEGCIPKIPSGVYKTGRPSRRYSHLFDLLSFHVVFVSSPIIRKKKKNPHSNPSGHYYIIKGLYFFKRGPVLPCVLLQHLKLSVPLGTRCLSGRLPQNPSLTDQTHLLHLPRKKLSQIHHKDSSPRNLFPTQPKSPAGSSPKGQPPPVPS